ncbi:hypothetical protein [Burkholderia phage vB_BpP_HN05]
MRNAFQDDENKTAMMDLGLGNAFPIVREVYKNLQKLTYVAEHLGELRPKDIELIENTANRTLDWRYLNQDGTKSDWQVLVPLVDITGQSPELRVNSQSMLQWKYVNEPDSQWRNIFDMSGYVQQTAQNTQDIAALKNEFSFIHGTSGATKVGFGNRSVAEAFVLAQGEFTQIPQYPNGFKGQATRIVAGQGRVLSSSRGSPSNFVTDTAPQMLDQLWTDVNLPELGVNWVAHRALQTIVGPNSNAMVAGLFSEMTTYNPGHGEAVGLVGFSKAMADKKTTTQQFHCWGGWFVGSNQGWRANVAGFEANATNQWADMPDNSDPMNSYPADFSICGQFFNDWSTYHGTRGWNVAGNTPYGMDTSKDIGPDNPIDPDNRVGWWNGGVIQDFVANGLWIDSSIKWQDPKTKQVPADPVGMTFGHHINRLMAFNVAVGDTRYQLNMESQKLTWRGAYNHWYAQMDDATKNLRFQNDKFAMTQSGRLNVGGVDSPGNTSLAGNGLTITGDNLLPLVLGVTTQGNTAPGKDLACIRVEKGTDPGTLKLVVYAGTSNIGAVIKDNIGLGNS